MDQLKEILLIFFVGGGSVGCQTLYHLAKRGVTNAVLLEKDQLTAGTTWHTAGLVWRLRPSDVEIQLLSVIFVFHQSVPRMYAKKSVSLNSYGKCLNVSIENFMHEDLCIPRECICKCTHLYILR